MSKIRPLLVVALALAACGGESGATEAWVWELPENVLPPRVPEDNPMTAAKVELGRFLFYDKKLSETEHRVVGAVTVRTWPSRTGSRRRKARPARSILAAR